MAPPTNARRAPAPPKTPEQIAAETRQRSEENEDAVLGTAEDDARSTRTDPANQNQDPLGGGVERREPIARAVTNDDIRSGIAARFRRTTPENERPFNGDMTEPENVIGEIGQNLEGRNPEDDDDLEREAMRRANEGLTGQAEAMLADDDVDLDEQQPAPVARKKLKVRGVDRELTDEEILEAARKTLAGDSYMEEARALLEEAKRIRGGTAADRSPTGDEHGTNELDPPELDGSPSQEPTTRDVVEKLQFGDPDEAAALLDRLVDSRSEKTASKGQLQRAFNQDLARSQKALKSFQDANPDLANDEIAAMAIEAGMYKLYSEDMKALGIDESQIPKDRSAVANWHRFYRINGYEVRPTSELLNAARDNFLKWRNKGQPSPSKEQPRRGAPNVQINVQRDARRAAIPVQPSRSTAIRRDPVAPAPSDRSSVVMNMRRARGQQVAQ